MIQGVVHVGGSGNPFTMSVGSYAHRTDQTQVGLARGILEDDALISWMSFRAWCQSPNTKLHRELLSKTC